MRPGLDDTLVSLRAPASFAAEQYQALRLQVERLRAVRDVRVLAISSPGLGDGKTVTAINLAAAHAESERVLLIDADLRRPSIGAQLRLTDVSGPGLADALSDDRLELTSLVRQVDDIPFAVILAGVPSAPVHELLRSPRLDHLLQEARRRFDLVIVDTPPLLPVTDAVVLARALDGIVVVVAANDTPRKLLEESLNLLDSSKVAGDCLQQGPPPVVRVLQRGLPHPLRERTMKICSLDVFVCPACHGALRLRRTGRGAEILEGDLTCLTCGSSYQITGGIPRFVRTEPYARSFAFQWQWFRDRADGLDQPVRPRPTRR